MLFGRNKTIRLMISVKCFLAVFLLFNLSLSVACQSKEATIKSVLDNCAESLNRDEVYSTFKCYQKTSENYSGSEKLIAEHIEEHVIAKCSEYKRNEDFKNALICFQGVAEIIPDRATVHFRLAHSLLEYAKQERDTLRQPIDLKLLDFAERAIQDGLKIAPEDGLAHSVYGEIYREKGLSNKALEEYQQAVKLAPKEVVLWTKLAMLQEQLNYNEDAVLSFQKALKINPNHLPSLWFLGELYEKTGKIDEAVEAIERRLNLEPNNNEVRQKLEDLKNKQKQLQAPKAKGKPGGVGKGTGNKNKP